MNLFRVEKPFIAGNWSFQRNFKKICRINSNQKWKSPSEEDKQQMAGLN
jgi:hypothetical protein